MTFFERVWKRAMVCLLATGALVTWGAEAVPKFRVLAFYTGKEDRAHISFVREANVWLPEAAKREGFSYEATTDWSRLKAAELAGVQVVLFLDTRPEDPAQRAAFQAYMEHGGAWMGFHFSAFALTPSKYRQDWDWYHNEFLGSGQYVSNTWRPTAAVLRVEAPAHPAVQGLPATFQSAPNEWYRWEKDLRKNPDITILLAIDPASFPLGTGPKPHEIWHEGYYPVVWTNKKYRMGHNDIDYEGKTNRDLSQTFANETEARLILGALRWLGSGEGKR
jgi:uncharacterized protein